MVLWWRGTLGGVGKQVVMGAVASALISLLILVVIAGAMVILNMGEARSAVVARWALATYPRCTDPHVHPRLSFYAALPRSRAQRSRRWQGHAS
jgi:hypothetical protein